MLLSVSLRMMKEFGKIKEKERETKMRLKTEVPQRRPVMDGSPREPQSLVPDVESDE